MGPIVNIREEAVSWTPTDDGQIVVLDLRSSRYLSLNASAARLWTRLIDSRAARADLVEDLREAYGLATADAERDVDAFLSALTERDLIGGPLSN